MQPCKPTEDDGGSTDFTVHVAVATFAVGAGMNRAELCACIIERGALRSTPAGVPALDLVLAHESVQVEAGLQRRVQAQVRAKAIGAVAERLDRQAAGSPWRFTGFLASPGGGSMSVAPRAKSVVLHILDFQPDQVS
jgi:primosomal replication protein N